MIRVVSAVSLFLVSFVLVVGTGVSGDGKKDKDKDPGKLKGQLPQGWKKLNLSPDQVQKIYAIQGQYKKKIQSLEEEIKDLRAQEKTEMGKVLSDQQKIELRKILIGEDDAKKDDKKPSKDDKKGDKKKDD